MINKVYINISIVESVEGTKLSDGCETFDVGFVDDLNFIERESS